MSISSDLGTWGPMASGWFRIKEPESATGQTMTNIRLSANCK
jgi:hypothetical protein